MDIVKLLVSLISGAVGGNIAGAAVKENNLGAVANSVIGLLGGVGGDYILQALDLFSKAPATTGFDVGAFVANVGVSGVSGAVLVAVVSYLKGYFSKA